MFIRAGYSMSAYPCPKLQVAPFPIQYRIRRPKLLVKDLDVIGFQGVVEIMVLQCPLTFLYAVLSWENELNSLQLPSVKEVDCLSMLCYLNSAGLIRCRPEISGQE